MRAKVPVAVVCVVTAGVGLASLGPSPVRAAEEAGGLQEVVVTAQKREETITSVPIAITAFSGDKLDSMGATDLSALENLTPGLSVAAQPTQGGGGLFVRGIGSSLFGVAVDPSVSVYVDGIYASRSVSTLTEFLDVGSVEVLRGPQGTLYGRNATGGAINIRSAQPTDELEGKADVTVGDFSAVRARMTLSGPLAQAFDGRASLLYDKRDAYQDNTFLGTTPRGSDVFAGRLSGVLHATDALSISASGEYYRDNAFGVISLGLTAPSPLARLFGATANTDPTVSRTDLTNPINRLEEAGGSITAKYVTPEFTFTSLTGYQDLKTNLITDADGSEAPLFDNRYAENSKTRTQELQLVSPSDVRLQWTTGLYYYNQSADGVTDATSRGFGFAPLHAVARVATAAWAAYGQSTWKITPRFSATLGGRFSHERKSHDVVSQTNSSLQFQGGTTTDLAGETAWNAWTPRAGINFTPTEHSLLYASASRGFKSGGFNSAGIQPSFNPEFVWTYEAGAKGLFFGDRLRVSSAIFYNNYTDLQLNVIAQVPGGANVVTINNAAKATTQGVEFEATWQVTSLLLVDCSASFLDAKFDRYVTKASNDPPAAPATDRKGNPLPYAPRVSTAAGFQQAWNIDSWNTLMIRGEMEYRSREFFDPYNDPLISTGGYSLFNARLEYSTHKSRFSVTAFVNNLSDKVVRISAVNAPVVLGYLQYYGPPRSYGVRVATKF